MGAAVASRLLSGGHEVTVWNRTRARSLILGFAALLAAIGVWLLV